MTSIDCSSIRAEFNERLNLIKSAVKQLNTIVNITPVAAMYDVLINKYSGVRISPDDIPTNILLGSPEAHMHIAEHAHNRMFYLSDWFCARFMNVVEQLQLTSLERERLIDNFLLHELFHRNQGFFANRHSGVRARDARALLEIDYQADAWAAQVQFAITTGSTDNLKAYTLGMSDYRDILLKIIQSCIHQTHMFCTAPKTKAPLREKKIPEFAGFRTSAEHLKHSSKQGSTYVPVQFFRNSAWHIQWHRCRLYNPCATVVSFNINTRPYLSARGGMSSNVKPNIRSISPSVMKTWGNTEVMLIAANHFGLNERTDDFSEPKYFQDFFNGIFTADPYNSGTGRYLTELLRMHPHFLGYPPNVDNPPNLMPPGSRVTVTIGGASSGVSDAGPPLTVKSQLVDSPVSLDGNNTQIHPRGNVTFSSRPIPYDMYNGNHMEQLRTKVESLFVQSTDPVVKPDDVELERLVENLELPKRSRKFGISTDRIKVLSNAKNTETQRASRSQKLVGDALEDEAKKEGQASAE